MEEPTGDGGVKKDPIWKQAALELVAEFTYGDIVSHEWLDSHLEVYFPDSPTRAESEAFGLERMSKIEGLREILREEHLIYLRNVKGVGYELLDPNKQTDVVMEAYKDTLQRAGEKAMQGLVYINRGRLASEEDKKNAEEQARVAWMRQSQRKTFARSFKVDHPGLKGKEGKK